MVSEYRTALAQRVYYGWIITIACFLATVAVFGSSYSFGVFYDSFLATFDVSRSWIALIFGVQTTLLYTGGIGAAWLVERRGQRAVLALSSALVVSGLGWAAFSQSHVELLLSLGVVTALGMSGVFIVSWATLPVWFERRRGTAGSIAASGTGVSLIFVPSGVEFVIAWSDWRTAMVVLAAAAGITLVLVVLLFADSPSGVGADPSVEFDDYRPPADGGVTWTQLRPIVLSAPFALLFVAWFAIYLPFYAILGHLVLHVSHLEVGRGVGVLALTIIGLTTTGTRLVVGRLSDYLGRERTFGFSAALLGSAAIGLASVETPGAILVAAAAVGAGYGGAGGLIGAITADLFGSHRVTAIFALLAMAIGVSGLVAPPLAGAWFEQIDSYRPAFTAAGLVGLTGSGIFALGVRRHRRHPPNQE